MNKITKRKKRVVLSEEELLRRSHIKDVRTTMGNIGFHRITGIEGKEIEYKNRRSVLMISLSRRICF